MNMQRKSVLMGSQCKRVASGANGDQCPKNVGIMRLTVMYTKQLTKKRKAWSDGILKVRIDGDLYYCTLIDADDVRETALDSRQLEPAEAQRFKHRQSHHLELDGFLVDVTFDDESTPQSSTSVPSSSNSFKIPKFVPPARFVPPRPVQTATQSSCTIPEDSVATANISKSSAPAVIGGRSYRMREDEIDDIWGQHQPIDESARPRDAPTDIIDCNEQAWGMDSGFPSHPQAESREEKPLRPQREKQLNGERGDSGSFDRPWPAVSAAVVHVNKQRPPMVIDEGHSPWDLPTASAYVTTAAKRLSPAAKSAVNSSHLIDESIWD